jgi:UDP-N-acetylglucosamine:LPS N-acetylglucosamine transferase
MRERLGLEPGERAVLIVGGAWGVGHLHDAALTVAAVPGMRPIVVAGHNDGLRRRIDTDPKLDAAVVFGFTGLMAGLMAASDVLVANAGGLTCLEAFAAGLPVVMFDPLPGHGEDNGRHMERAGMITAAASEPDLRATLADNGFWAVRAPETAARALALFERPCTAEQLAALRPAAGPTRALVRLRRVAVVAAAVMALGMADKAVDAVAVTHVPAHQGAVVQWEGR